MGYAASQAYIRNLLRNNYFHYFNSEWSNVNSYTQQRATRWDTFNSRMSAYKYASGASIYSWSNPVNQVDKAVERTRLFSVLDQRPPVNKSYITTNQGEIVNIPNWQTWGYTSARGTKARGDGSGGWTDGNNFYTSILSGPDFHRVNISGGVYSPNAGNGRIWWLDSSNRLCSSPSCMEAKNGNISRVIQNGSFGDFINWSGDIGRFTYCRITAISDTQVAVSVKNGSTISEFMSRDSVRYISMPGAHGDFGVLYMGRGLYLLYDQGISECKILNCANGSPTVSGTIIFVRPNLGYISQPAVLEQGGSAFAFMYAAGETRVYRALSTGLQLMDSGGPDINQVSYVDGYYYQVGKNGSIYRSSSPYYYGSLYGYLGVSEITNGYYS